jgi:hypothetical protein
MRLPSLTLPIAVLSTLAAAGATLGAQARTGANAARTWTVPRTPDGHPDFQGVWANNTVTPLQRPKQWEGKTRLTDAEIAELLRFAVRHKELKHRINDPGFVRASRSMSQIGG